MKKWLLIAVLVILAGIGSWAAWIYFSKDAFLKAIYLVPKDAIYVVETQKPISSWKDLSESKIWTFLRTHPSFAEIDANARYLDSLIHENETAFQLLGNRNVVISAHMTRPRDYDFLYIIDLEKSSKSGLIQDQAERLFKAMHFKVTQREYENSTILEIYDPISRETFFLSFQANHAICSFTGKLIEKAILEAKDPVIGRDPRFTDVSTRVSEDGLCRIYLQFAFMDDYLQCYGSSNNEFVKSLSSTLAWSALNFDADNEFFTLNGFTSVNDSVDSYLSALLQTGRGNLNAPELLPERTAFFVSLGFKNFQEFYDIFMKELSKDPAAYKTYQDNYRKTEKLLKLNLRADFLDWIGQEIIFATPAPADAASKDEYLVIIEPNDLSKAQAGMEHIMRQIKRRTPGKFKEKTYNEQTIYYLEMKGLFRLFFGKLFASMEKPYLTWYDGHLVMSNQIETLQHYLDDQKAGKTLAKSTSFGQLASKLNNKANVTIYGGFKKMFPMLKGFASPGTWQSLQSSAPYVNAFTDNAFQLSGEAGLFETRLYMLFSDPAVLPEVIPSDSTAAPDSLAAADSTSAAAPNPAPTETTSEDGKLAVTEYAPGRKKSETELKEGVKDGKHTEYHPNGEISVKGSYKDGEPSGVWKYYDEQGKIIRKENH